MYKHFAQKVLLVRNF